MTRTIAVSTVLLALAMPALAQDSLNTRFFGNWPFGEAASVALDPERNLTFLGSGGGVYVLDMSDPAEPVKLSEAIHTRGVVHGLFFEAKSESLVPACLLYVATGGAGLEV